MMGSALNQMKTWAGMVALGAGCCAMDAAPPNIVFILADDLGWMDTSVYQKQFSQTGDAYYETPNIDRLAEQGMRFTQACVSPMCSPTRAMLLTGRHNVETGVIKATVDCPHDENFNEIVDPDGWQGDREFAVLPASNRMFLDGKYETFAERLNQVGYRCGFLGKWHIGYHNQIESATPMAQGFETIAYFDKGGSNYRNWYAEWERYGKPMAQPKDSYLTVAESREACRFIEENRRRPFLLYYCSGAVHSPFQDDPASGYREHFEKKGREGWLDDRADPYPVYAAMVKSFDDAVGRILDKLERTNGADGRPLSESTLVVFLSDNGGINRFQFAPEGHKWHDKVITSNVPLRGGKGNVFEGGVRVPFIVRWPGRVAPGAVCKVPVTGQDIYSLLLEAGGLEPRLGHGSLSALLKDPTDAAGYGRDTLFLHFPFWWPSTEAGAALPHDVPASAVRRGRFKLIRYYSGKTELYDLETDLGEKDNLAARLPETVGELNQILQDWLDQVDPAYMPQPNPKYLPEASRYN